MPAFHHDVLDRMRSLIAKVSTQIRTHGKPNLTVEEMVTAFWPEELREQSVEVTKLFNASWDNALVLRMPTRSPVKALRFQFVGHPAPAVPKEPLRLSKADPVVANKINDWAEHEVSTAQNYGLVTRVLEELNNRCTSAAQVRFFWPAIIQLLDHVEGDDQPALKARALAAKLRMAKPPARLPSLPVGLREVLQQTGGYVTGGLLTETNPVAETYVTAYLWNEDFKTFDMPDLPGIVCV
jgi:hypothetical protein